MLIRCLFLVKSCLSMKEVEHFQELVIWYIVVLIIRMYQVGDHIGYDPRIIYYLERLHLLLTQPVQPYV